VLGAGLAAAILILRPANDASWALTRAATGYTVLRVAVVALIAVLGFSTPIIPPILIAAVASDALLNARWRVWIVGPLIAVLLQLTYAPYLRLAPHGITITGDDLITSTIATTAVVTAILGCGEIERRGVRRIVAATGTIGITLLVLAPPAFAHDPGQGTPRGNARLQVRFDGDDATFRARIMPQDCDELHPRDTIARRAGVARHRALTEQAQCSFTSRLRLPSKGRWFLYARFFDRGKAVEAWIPVDRGEGASARRELYEPPAPTTGAGKVALGVALYGIGLTVLLASIRVARVTNQSSSVRTRSGAPQCRP